MTSHLNLFFEDKHVGVLSEDEEERLSFRYTMKWHESDDSFPISMALKLEDKEYGHIEAKTFSKICFLRARS